MALKQMKVLYIEDDRQTMEAMSLFLQRRVGTLVTAADGREGVEKFYEERPDIAIVDLLLPEIEGIEVIRKIRSVDRECKILVTTTVENLDVIVKAVDLNISFYVMKPVRIKEFEQQLEAAAASVGQAEAARTGKKISFADDGERSAADTQIKAKLAKWLKEKTGKGAQTVKICYFDSSVEILFMGAYTALELSLLSEKRNTAIVESQRRLFYEMTAAEVERTVAETLGTELRLKTIDVDAARQADRLVLEV